MSTRNLLPRPWIAAAIGATAVALPAGALLASPVLGLLSFCGGCGSQVRGIDAGDARLQHGKVAGD